MLAYHVLPERFAQVHGATPIAHALLVEWDRYWALAIRVKQGNDCILASAPSLGGH
jgi:hypothetical protein